MGGWRRRATTINRQYQPHRHGARRGRRSLCTTLTRVSTGHASAIPRAIPREDHRRSPLLTLRAKGSRDLSSNSTLDHIAAQHMSSYTDRSLEHALGVAVAGVDYRGVHLSPP